LYHHVVVNLQKVTRQKEYSQLSEKSDATLCPNIQLRVARARQFVYNVTTGSKS